MVVAKVPYSKFCWVTYSPIAAKYTVVLSLRSPTLINTGSYSIQKKPLSIT
ncbi:Uncharacterised protein [Vibrio cholerae]|nr:Uncharacterised protein [Vibrio cholerae]